MILSIRFLRKNLFHCLLYIVFTILFAASSFGAVLNPFPTQKRIPQYQEVPRYPQIQSPQEIARFKRDIARFQCPQLKKLQVGLRGQYKAVVSTADKAYYKRFLKELYGEMGKKNCHQ